MLRQIDPLRRNRIILIGLAAVVLGWVAWAARDALGPFVFALALGYLLVPLVDRVARVVPRAVAILIVYALFVGAAVGIGFLIIPAAASQVRELIRNVPHYQQELTGTTSDLQNWYNSLDLPPDVRTSLENGVRNSAGGVLAAAEGALFGTVRAVVRTISFVFGLLVIPFWLFYVLKDRDAGVRSFYRLIPQPVRGDVRRMLQIAGDVLNDYIRGQLLLGLVVGAATVIGLGLVGAPYWVLLGVLNGLTELIPILGPILGAIPGLIVAALQGDLTLFLKVLVVYIVVQLAENNLLVPKIQGDSVKLHPAIIILALVIGGEIGGLLGVIVAVPLTAIVRDLYLYVYHRLGLGYTPHTAEALVPSRLDEEAAGKQEA
jgi:predicted PurR-regulated permease PerM